ncbi:uncharacterized protein J3D65DRAFT_144469 [Phyllosticta citribraziliensis]|uniref:Uncharacterized protein n=1 Tax=Phyllosticta citribraziliensis TaxID=989973 RepID=A0ABR1L6Y6_9PEZI
MKGRTWPSSSSKATWMEEAGEGVEAEPKLRVNDFGAMKRRMVPELQDLRRLRHKEAYDAGAAGPQADDFEANNDARADGPRSRSVLRLYSCEGGARRERDTSHGPWRQRVKGHAPSSIVTGARTVIDTEVVAAVVGIRSDVEQRRNTVGVVANPKNQSCSISSSVLTVLSKHSSCTLDLQLYLCIPLGLRQHV